jgi:hypothetical protein
MLADEGTSMAGRASDPAFPLDTEAMDWIPTGPGKSFRPLRFEAGGWTELMRLEPGSGVPLHRHSGEVHAYCLTGTREIGPVKLIHFRVLRPGRSRAPTRSLDQAAMCTSQTAHSTRGGRSATGRASCT